jgi:hypothetical protein
MPNAIDPLPFDVITAPVPPALVVAGFSFDKKGGFKTSEHINYSQIQSEYSFRTLDLMALAHRISEDLGIVYLEVFQMLKNEDIIALEFGAYAEEIKEVAIRDFCDIRRKSDLVTMFMRSRIDKAWTDEKTGDLMWEDEAELIYEFLMNEYHRWKEPVSIDLTTADVGKSLEISASASNAA